MINSVKLQADGYLVNGVTTIPFASGNRRYREVQAWINAGNTPDPEFTQGELGQQVAQAALIQAKFVRDLALSKMEHDFGDGRVVQTRPQDLLNIRNAIEAMTAMGTPNIQWVMKDNIKRRLSVDDLKVAMLAGQTAGIAVWANYNPNV